MMLHIPRVLTADQVSLCRKWLAKADWADGGATAGVQSARAKRNLQLLETSATGRTLGDMVLESLANNAAFISAALPLRVFPPMFNCYGEGMGFGDHIDNAIRYSQAQGLPYRTDLSCTLFLADPDQYDGGALVMEDGFAPRPVKLPAGDLILYPATTVHKVEPVTRGERLAAFFWVQSMVRDGGQRSLLHQLDQAISAARTDLTDAHPAAVALTGVYHNLIRMWAEV
jgi:PKHD-type hydroxylase